MKSNQSAIVWQFFVAGVLLLMFSFSILDSPVISVKGGYEIDVGSFQIPLACVSMGIAVYFIFSAFAGKQNQKKRDAERPGKLR